ncbi:MAG: EscC/YscC/HrcC family type III secretion system outer membrane ring protein [Desulfobacteraceae bacterium]|nr:EscC/YscC/HrcC family type III secretion system outer membrane ring protein [Desulfobacteraceae bacterium]
MKSVYGAIIAITILLSAFSATAQEVIWPVRTYTHLAVEEDLTLFLRDFLSQHGFESVISTKIKGKISGYFETFPKMELRKVNVEKNENNTSNKSQGFKKVMPANNLFDQITSAYGLIWYARTNTFYIYDDTETKHRSIYLKNLTYDKLKSVLDLMNIYDPRFPLIHLGEQGMLHVSGPPVYVNLVTESIDMMEKKAEPKDEEVIRIFELKYAWADDQYYPFRGSAVVLPGVVTMLKKLLYGKTGVPTQDSPLKQIPGQQHALSGQISNSSANQLTTNLSESANPNQDDTLSTLNLNSVENDAANANVSEQATIISDMRLNAVIIRDKSSRMQTYASLIEAIDKPAGLVEIKASIIDVNMQELEELGIDWELSAEGQGYSIGSGFASQALNLGLGLLTGAITSSQTSSFMATIHALQDEGQADILSRPSVLTLNNTEAVFEDSSTFYVRLGNSFEETLQSFSAGIYLRVTPHIIVSEGRRKIKISVVIEDGSVSDELVDDIPQIERSVITTQAVIEENTNLLIGGIINKSDVESVEKVPILGNIPLLGYLFRHKKTKQLKNERLFLITPRIVDFKTQTLTADGEDSSKITHGAAASAEKKFPVSEAPAVSAESYKYNKELNNNYEKYDTKQLVTPKKQQKTLDKNNNRPVAQKSNSDQEIIPANATGNSYLGR